MAIFHSEINPPQRTRILGSCHSWFLKTFSENEYVCVTCGTECVGAKNMSDAHICSIMVIPRNWLPEKDPKYSPTNGETP